MRMSRWLVAALAGFLGCATAVDAQRSTGPGPTSSRSATSSRYGHSRGRFPLSAGLVPVRFRGYYGTPLGFRGYYPAPLTPFYGPSYSSLTIINLAPPPPPPPIIVIQAPPPILINGRLPEMPLDRPDLGVPDAAPMPMPGGDRKPPPLPPAPAPAPAPAPGKDVLPPPRPEKDKPKEAPPPPRKPDREPEFPAPPGPEDDPRDEHARLVRAGREAFAELEYGRAAARFRQATRLLAAEPLPYFLLGQALLAQGNYHTAFDAIRDGMRLQPGWPRAGFRPLELYGRHVDEYSALVRSTEKALARHPLDPELLFLRGYVLWFDGRKEQARGFFRQALPGAANRDAIDRFLRALPDDAGL